MPPPKSVTHLKDDKRKNLAGGCDFPGSPGLHMIDLEFLIKIHFIDSQLLNYLNNKAIAFDRTC